MIDSRTDDESLSQMVEIIQRDIGKRGIKNIFPEDNPISFKKAAQSLIKSKKVAILTGFSCLVDFDPHIETDGIAGALALAKTLINLNKQVVILMDDHCDKIMKQIVFEYFKDLNTNLQQQVSLLCLECGKNTLTDLSLANLEEISKTFDAIVSIERPSVNPTGNYMTMRAIDIIKLTSEFDQYLYPQVGQAKKNPNQTLISIGDGGNEVGMGSVIELVKQFIPNGEKICANTYCDHLLVSDTSNFGAYALVNAIQLELIKLLETDKKQLISLFPPIYQVSLEAIQETTNIREYLFTIVGVLVSTEKNCASLLQKFEIRDGISKEANETVDGIDFNSIAEIINEMQQVIDKYQP